MNIFKHSLFAVALLIGITSCKRSYTDSKVVGPTNIAASENFSCGALTTSFGTSADFTLPIPKFFIATFPETVTWKIELEGVTSKATKTIAGTSSALNVSNATWTGNHDGLYFFETGETVVANLIISGKQGVCTSTTFTIAAEKDYTVATPTFMLVNAGSNFETAIGYPDQFSIFPSGGTDAPAYKVQNDSIRAPEGVQYMRLEGVSKEANGFFVGGLQSRRNGGATVYFLPPAWTDPNQLYLNIYVRGIENLPKDNLPYATLNFECQEDDRMDGSTIDNCTYYANKPSNTNTDNFCPSSEDSWVFKIPVNHIGWKLFSCKYSDLLPSEDFANGGFGNRKLEPQKIARVQFGLVSSPPFNRVSVDIDFACFTYGAPLDPHK
ncbi:hypothetical protein [Cytophaga hutchinsonii]|uniref:Lipoprotein n=1 Tax=Cytophaga hutchinsonii (strain ATCC 33406 / DSM 1761 / CIP 103989 / NBRC 15051 / NCIMB 9469 / D465) TaxID=269798 RepID=A0A6N4SQE3_CYTH3|nr:hypothetical protein [Cytophaga hutchinsonii]ABG58550.1 hypothetical protein CHU_1278 [Cytophaga hutchinsonii ATCC 33406]SFX76801.1 hypothetical protein SAMN04487930_109117 [Cytophaga hutchinsonii ATCC 33406]